jgi:histidine triad (HIT) family protein
MISRLLFKIAKLSFVRPIVGLAFSYFGMLLPLRRLVETRYSLAFFHPKPAWKPHILIVPKKIISDWFTMRPGESLFFADLLLVAQKVASSPNLFASGFALISNGGAYQEIPQLHFHLAEGTVFQDFETPRSLPTAFDIDEAFVKAYRHPDPFRTFHYVIAHMGHSGTLLDVDRSEVKELYTILVAAQRLVVKYELGREGRGYALFTNSKRHSPDNPYLSFHLIS